MLRKTVPSAPLTLIGHSAGGGFTLRVAGSPIQNLFERFVLLAPYLGYDAPSTRPSSGGWASADIPRILGLLALRKLGITCCEALPVLALAVPPNSEKTLVSTYTDRLMRNFAVRGDFRHDLAAATKPQPHGYRRRAEGGIPHRRRCRHARHGGVIAAMWRRRAT